MGQGVGDTVPLHRLVEQRQQVYARVDPPNQADDTIEIRPGDSGRVVSPPEPQVRVGVLAAGEARHRQRPDPLTSQREEKQRSPRLVLTHDDMRRDARGLSEVLKPTRYQSK